MSAQQAYVVAVKDLADADSDVELSAGRVRAPFGALVKLRKCSVTYKGNRDEVMLQWMEFGQSVNVWFWEGEELREAQTVVPEPGIVINHLEIPLNFRTIV
jgi:hypothetical protein